MKIAILTQPIMFNYGGILQNYALQTVLRKKKHDVETINRLPDFSYPITIRHALNYIHRLIRRTCFHDDISISWNPNLSQTDFDFLSQNVKPFISRNIVLTPPITNKQLSSYIKNVTYDAYVVGSDQVWIPSYAKQSFIDFDHRKNILKIAYAASCGNKSWIDDNTLTSECVVLAKDFKALSTREPGLAQRASSILHREVQWVLDPTLLLSKEEYLNAITIEEERKPFIFAYILDFSPYKKKMIKTLADKLNVDVRYCIVDEKTPGESIDWWINSISLADFVITDSFHGTALSIVFEKQFCVFGNEKRGNVRFDSILSIADLRDRVISEECDLNYQLAHVIDYKYVNSCFTAIKNDSLKFLYDNLNDVCR